MYLPSSKRRRTYRLPVSFRAMMRIELCRDKALLGAYAADAPFRDSLRIRRRFCTADIFLRCVQQSIRILTRFRARHARPYATNAQTRDIMVFS